MFKKLRIQFIILNMSIISTILFAAFAFAYLTVYNNIQNENIDKLSRSVFMPYRISFSTGYVDMYDDSERIGNLSVNRAIPLDFLLSFNIILNSDGSLERINSLIDMPEESYKIAANLVYKSTNSLGKLTIDNRKWMYQFNEINLHHVAYDGIVYPKYQVLFLDITDSSVMLNNLLIVFIFIGTIMLFVIFGISLYFANRSIKPIEVTWSKQKQFIADASHELKTPIAVINANTEAMLVNQDKTIENQKKWITHIKSESERMGSLVDNLLYLAKTEDTHIKINNTIFDISEMVNDAILSIEYMIYEKDIILSQDIESEIMINSDLDRAKQLVMILLDNALKYTDPLGNINVSLKKYNRYIVFSVENTGAGISKDEIPRIFDRFYRVDSVRTKSGSYGLGLAIAKAIIERLRGKISVSSVENKSTIFKFTLPIK